MKQIEISGEFLENEEFRVIEARDLESGVTINTPSTMLGLIRIKKKLREPLVHGYGFAYSFPLVFSPTKHETE